MAKILLTWELGAGLGHLTRLRPLVEYLSARGHEMHLAVRTLASVDTVFADQELHLYQAPITHGKSPAHIEHPVAFSHILHNCGFSHESELRTRVKAWDRLYELIRPDMVIFDHSPTALMAARGREFAKVVVGSSFMCPPDKAPLPTLQPWQDVPQSVLLKEEGHTVRIANQALENCDKPRLRRLSELYHQTDLMLLTTFKELDHFGERPNFRYSGCWPTFPGDAPEWPSASGQRIFAYLKYTPKLEGILNELKRTKLPTLVYGKWVNEAIAEEHSSGTLRLVRRPLDLKQVAAECDLAILNGTHGATAAMLLGGTPTLQLPIFLEQHLFAHRVVQYGAAMIANEEDVSSVGACLKVMLNSDQFATAAGRFAATYSQVDPERLFTNMMDRVEELLPATVSSARVQRVHIRNDKTTLRT